MGVRVVTDSASDLPEQLARDLGIEIVPLKVRFGDEELVDRIELSNAEFWSRLATAPDLPETSAPSAGAFEERFRALVDDGATGIVCINISSKLSATMQAAQLAAKSLEGTCPIAVIDSLTGSMGIGNLCISAARRVADGADFETIVEETTVRRDRTKLFGALDTLEFLRRGGRIGGAQALLGSMLSIKPIIETRDGMVEEAGKVRTRSKALQFLVERAKEGPVENLVILHAQAPDLDEMLSLLDPIASREEIVIGEIGPVIGTHIGPRAIGLTWHVPRS